MAGGGIRRRRKKNSSGPSPPPASKRMKTPSTKIDFAARDDYSDSDDDDLDRRHRHRHRHDDHSIDSDDDDHHHDYSRSRKESDEEKETDEEEAETVDAKRVRLAREYLRSIEKRVGDSDDAGSSSSEDETSSSEAEGSDNDEENFQSKVAMKLARERLKREGALERTIADRVCTSVDQRKESSLAAISVEDAEASAKAWVAGGHAKYLRGHDLTVTCVSLHCSGEVAYSGSKDGSVCMWDVERGERKGTIIPQWNRQLHDVSEASAHRGDGEVLATACSDDGRYLAVGMRDATVKIFDVRLSKAAGGNVGSAKNGANIRGLVTSFKGHKGPVTCLTFRSQTLQLFSGSDDRCIRHYNLEELAYIETLYGHQAGVTGIDCHRQEKPISTGRDRTARSWKIAEDSHLIFRGGSRVSSADCVSVVKDNWFLTGHDDGKLSLWMTEKKKAVATIESAHGAAAMGGLPRGLTSCSALKGSDVAATGSNDGYLRLWKVMTGQSLNERGLEPLTEIPIHGYINGLAIGPKARFCVTAIGQEHRLGRWGRVSRAKNRFGIVMLRGGDAANDEEDNIGDDEGVVDATNDGAESESPSEESEDDDSDSSSEESDE